MPQTLRVHVPELSAGLRQLSAEAAHYVARVHRLGAGDRFVAFDPEAALETDATVVRVAHGQVTCEFREPHTPACLGPLPVTLVHAPAKGERFEDVVRAATALGVRAIHLVHSERSVFVPNQKNRERLRVIAIDGARQSGRGDLPALIGPAPLAEALERIRVPFRLCLHPRASLPLQAHLTEWSPSVEAAVLVGPEGGFSDPELDAVRAAGWQLAALGPLTLRAELAAIAAVSCFAAHLPGVVLRGSSE